MYCPKKFEETDQAKCLEFIDKHDFGLLLNQSENLLMTLTPMILKSGKICGHIARANFQSEIWETKTPVSALFQGPHCYISPSYYESQTSVPTWNYTAVRVDGKLSVIEDRASKVDLINTLVEKYEKGNEYPWRLNPSSERHMALFAAIVCFEIEIESIKGIFKLNQNKSVTDQESVRQSLIANGRYHELGVASMMKQSAGQKG